MFTYKNKTNQELTIPSVGVVAPGGTIQSSLKLENQHLEEVSTQQVAPQQPKREEDDK